MKNVLLLFCQGTEIFEAAAFYDVLGWSGSNGFEEVRVTTAASTSQVTCTFGLKVTVDLPLTEVVPENYHALAVPGGFEEFGFYADAYSPPVQGLIARFAALNKPIASICVAALPIARAGLLAGKRATVYHLGDGRQRKQLAAQILHILALPNLAPLFAPGSRAEVAIGGALARSGRPDTRPCHTMQSTHHPWKNDGPSPIERAGNAR